MVHVAVTDTVAGTVGDIHMLTQDLFQRLTSVSNSIDVARKNWRVLANVWSHMCRQIHKFPLTTNHSQLPAPLNHLQQTSNFLGILRHRFYHLIVSVDNHICIIDNSISLCTQLLSTIQQIQWHIYSGGCTVADSIQWQIYSGGYSAR